MKIVLTRDQFEELQIEYPRARSDYEGRGSFRNTCLGVTLDSLRGANGVVKHLAYMLAEQRAEEEGWEEPELGDIEFFTEELHNRMQSDDMGLDMIVYWTNVTVADEEDN